MELITVIVPWMDKGFLKSSKRKQILHDKFLKIKSPRNEDIYKACKSFFESLKKKPKKNYNTSHLESHQNDIRKTWDIIKNIIGEGESLFRGNRKSIFLNASEFGKMKKLVAEIGNVLLVRIQQCTSSEGKNGKFCSELSELWKQKRFNFPENHQINQLFILHLTQRFL